MTSSRLDATPALRVERIETLDKLVALESEWRDLYVRSGIAIPFLTFEWALCWWKHMRRSSLTSFDRLAVRVVRDEGGTLIAIAPMIRTFHPGIGPLRFSCLQFFGADANLTELRTILTLPEFEGAVWKALADDIDPPNHPGKRDWHWIKWTGMPQREEVRTILDRPGYRPTPDLPEFVLETSGSWEDLRKGLKRNIRESLRKCYNSLKRDEIDWQFRVAQTPEAISEAVERFLPLHLARSQLQGTVRHGDFFESARCRRFLREVTQLLTGKYGGGTRVFEIVIAGKVVASRIAFRFGDHLYLYFSGYEPEWRRYSIMTTVVAEAIQHSISEGVQSINLSTGSEVSKTRWSPRQIDYWQGIQLAPGSAAAFARKAYTLTLGLRIRLGLTSPSAGETAKKDQTLPLLSFIPIIYLALSAHLAV